MSNDLHAALQKALQAHETRLRELEAEVEVTKSLIDGLNRRISLSQNDEATTTEAAIDNSSRNTREQTKNIVSAIEKLLMGRDEPTPTSKILEEIEGIGIRISGKTPQNNLAAMLSYHSASFKSHGRQGWTYVGSQQ